MVITSEAVGEGVQRGKIIGVNGVCPCRQSVAPEVADHPREGMHVVADSSELRASAEYFAQLTFLVVAQVLGVPHDPVSDLLRLEYGGCVNLTADLGF
ncbi:hypothetical protein OHB41_48410 [Streptomyces sp. NBC_01571]|uniref:hypothetical protein n=1 Tax=Streptomyces sp. NBC_01571 TaxID=2975883 RepID=UPI002253B7A6|nr:hypothetical protein [Streptomyces sp. NBC_01571]MCX4580805.1 hypothetical protein [Streptomyces sp. NBC_01571]